MLYEVTTVVAIIVALWVQRFDPDPQSVSWPIVFAATALWIECVIERSWPPH